MLLSEFPLAADTGLRNWFTRNFLIGKAFLQLKSINARQGEGSLPEASGLTIQHLVLEPKQKDSLVLHLFFSIGLTGATGNF